MAIAPKKTAPAQVVSNEQLFEMIKRLQAENETLKATAEASVIRRPRNEFSIKVSPSGKGNLCIYGLGRYPFSFYRNQIEAILAHAATIKTFIAKNEEALSKKGE